MNFMTMSMDPPDPHPGKVESPGGPGDDEGDPLPTLLAAPVRSIWDVMYDETGIPRDRGEEIEAEIQNAYCEVLDYEHGLVDRPSAMKALLREITNPMELIVAGFIMAMAEQRFMEYAIRAQRHAEANHRLEKKKTGCGEPSGYG